MKKPKAKAKNVKRDGLKNKGEVRCPKTSLRCRESRHLEAIFLP